MKILLLLFPLISWVCKAQVMYMDNSILGDSTTRYCFVITNRPNAGGWFANIGGNILFNTNGSMTLSNGNWGFGSDGSGTFYGIVALGVSNSVGLISAVNGGFSFNGTPGTDKQVIASANGRNVWTNYNAADLSGTLDGARLNTLVTNGYLRAVDVQAQTNANTMTLNDAQTASGAKSLTNAANSFVGMYSGNLANGTNLPASGLASGGTFPAENGSALTALNASSLASGSVADARLSANVALLNGSQTFSGSNAYYSVSATSNNLFGIFGADGKMIANANGTNDSFEVKSNLVFGAQNQFWRPSANSGFEAGTLSARKGAGTLAAVEMTGWDIRSSATGARSIFAFDGGGGSGSLGLDSAMTFGWTDSSTDGTGTKTVTFDHPANGTLRVVATAVNIGSVVTSTNGFASYASNLTAPVSIGSSIAATNGGFNWTNTITSGGVPISITVFVDNQGVTATSIKKNGGQIFSSALGDQTIPLHPNQWISILYAVGTPTITYTP